MAMMLKDIVREPEKYPDDPKTLEESWDQLQYFVKEYPNGSTKFKRQMSLFKLYSAAEAFVRLSKEHLKANPYNSLNFANLFKEKPHE